MRSEEIYIFETADFWRSGVGEDAAVLEIDEDCVVTIGKEYVVEAEIAVITAVAVFLYVD